MQNDFDNHFKQTRRLAFLGMFFSLIVSLSVLGFLGWVIVVIMNHFGII